MMYVLGFVVVSAVVLVGLKTLKRRRVYHCRARGCGRTFIDPLERSNHRRRCHLS